MDEQTTNQESNPSFFEQPGVRVDEIPVHEGVPFGVTRISNPALGIGGAYGAWGDSYNNTTVNQFVEDRMGRPLTSEEHMDLDTLGFFHRHHVTGLTDQENTRLEVTVGARILQEAMAACGWQAEEVGGVLLGSSAPIVNDFTEQVTREAGISESALKISVHKACDSSVGGLHLALNPALEVNEKTKRNIAAELLGKKVLVGAVEGLSRFVQHSRDAFALQLFGNAAGAIGLIPGKTMKFLVGKDYETYDEQGVLSVSMNYPYAGHPTQGESRVEVTDSGNNSYRVAGQMHEPEDGSSIVMAGPMGMVKLFVRSGVQVVQDVFLAYQAKLNELGVSGERIKVAIVHHANKKINFLKAKHLENLGIRLPMPWILNEFGNVSAASNMIAFLRQLPGLKPGDQVLFDGFGAGTYYDALVVELGGAESA